MPNGKRRSNVKPHITQGGLFPEYEESVPAPEGLRYSPDFLREAEELDLAAWIDAQPWDTGYSRRRQFYGKSYGPDDTHRETPAILSELAQRLFEEGLVHQLPDQILINEYLPGQGIAAHVDYHPEFGDEVAMVSLLDPYPMRFAKGNESFEVVLERRSACVISGPSRYEWTHEIARRLSDPSGGGRRTRGRRLSVTFRKRL